MAFFYLFLIRRNDQIRALKMIKIYGRWFGGAATETPSSTLLRATSAEITYRLSFSDPKIIAKNATLMAISKKWPTNFYGVLCVHPRINNISFVAARSFIFFFHFIYFSESIQDMLGESIGFNKHHNKMKYVYFMMPFKIDATSLSCRWTQQQNSNKILASSITCRCVVSIHSANKYARNGDRYSTVHAGISQIYLFILSCDFLYVVNFTL